MDIKAAMSEMQQLNESVEFKSVNAGELIKSNGQLECFS
jgi:hypothetical protein